LSSAAWAASLKRHAPYALQLKNGGDVKRKAMLDRFVGARGTPMISTGPAGRQSAVRCPTSAKDDFCRLQGLVRAAAAPVFVDGSL
jgi:hypothetical protein